ncbi:MAG: enoyl-CoA hydratase-related protein [Dehalococcoidia bacterium]|nr:enoyl-CoA hydratase-related protein [Dehalococcoidia bacterium]
MDKKKFIDVEFKDKYAIIYYELVDDLVTKETIENLQLELKNINNHKHCLAVLFISRTTNSSIGWSKELIVNNGQCIKLVDELLNEIASLDMPTIFLLKGKSYSAGLELSLACDIRFASCDTQISLLNVSNDYIPADSSINRLSRSIPKHRVLELLLFHKIISADDAYSSGLISAVYDNDIARSESIKFTQEIANRGPIAIKVLKQVMSLGSKTDINTGMEIEHEGTIILQNTDDFIEGTDAFLNKRKPNFEGK